MDADAVLEMIAGYSHSIDANPVDAGTDWKIVQFPRYLKQHPIPKDYGCDFDWCSKPP